jgi:uncharacterized protein YndB with AHSA1/START domain
MGTLVASAERQVGAPADDVYRYIADHREHHPHFLPPAFSDFEVVSGGVGTGTVTRFKLTVGGRTRQFRMTVAEPEPGRVMTETDSESTLVTTWTVTPRDNGTSTVRISTTWQGADGIGGFFERLFAPPAVRRLYADELTRLDTYARDHRT